MQKFRAQLNDLDPSLGLRLEFAMGWYGDQAIAQRRGMPLHLAEAAIRYTLKHRLQPGDASYIDPDRLPEMRRKAARDRDLLLTDIAAQLRSGKLYAVGLRVGEYQPVRIPREWWGIATLNPELNTAEGNGVTFSGLLIFETERDKGQTELTAAEWMATNVTRYVPNQRDARVAECRIALSITKEEAMAGWKVLPEAIKGRSRVSGR